MKRYIIPSPEPAPDYIDGECISEWAKRVMLDAVVIHINSLQKLYEAEQ